MSAARPAPIAFGRYLLYERIAVGGMAELFRAEDSAGQVCVIKRVLPHLSTDRRFLTMLLDEARLAATLSHPGVTRILELGREGEHLFIAMEYLAGEDCAELIAGAAERGAAVPWPLAASIVTAAADALHFAHEARSASGASLALVHRDVTPSNLFVTYAGEVKLLDFGIASWAERFERTATGKVKGKSGYMSPEQQAGEAVDRRADLWALGVCLRELGGGSAPPELDEIISRATRVDPRDRYPTAAAFAYALRARVPPVEPAQLGALLRTVFGEQREREKLDRAKPSGPVRRNPTQRLDDAPNAPDPSTARTQRLDGGRTVNLADLQSVATTQPLSDPGVPRPVARSRATPLIAALFALAALAAAWFAVR